VLIELASLEGGKGKFSHQYAAGELVLEDERLHLVEPPKVSGEISRDGQKVKVKGSAVARLQLECDRCLKLVDLPVASKFALEYITAADYEAQTALELAANDLNQSVFDGEAIDLDALVSEELLLSVPDQILCSDVCKGICASCGADRNVKDCGCETAEIDPRWAGLKELVNGKS
jgi:uncharacterized protein